MALRVFFIIRYFLRKCKGKKLIVAESVNGVVKVFVSSLG